MSVPRRTSSLSCLLFLLLSPCVAAAQNEPAIDTDQPVSAANERLGQWTPMGRLPVDQAGAGLRGYVLAGESTDVTPPAGSQISLHAVAANNFYREQTDPFTISQRYETHTVALGYRRGFTIRKIPRFEIGGQLQLIESDSGFMNGFISGSENFLARMTGQPSARNPFRSVGAEPPMGTVVTDAGRRLYQASGIGSGWGDLSLVAKALVRDGDPSSSRARVAVRIGANIAGTSAFTQGNFIGIGASVDTRVLRWAALHGDIRGSLLLDRESQWHLPLKRTSLGFSLGPELRLSTNNSASVQIDGSTTPYLPTGTTALDRAYGDITLGFSHRSHQIVTQAYLRENMNLPFRVRWNADPDLSLGIKVTIHARPR